MVVHYQRQYSILSAYYREILPHVPYSCNDIRAGCRVLVPKSRKRSQFQKRGVLVEQQCDAISGKQLPSGLMSVQRGFITFV